MNLCFSKSLSALALTNVPPFFHFRSCFVLRLVAATPYGQVVTTRMGPYWAVAVAPDGTLYLLCENRLEILNPVDESLKILPLEGDRVGSVSEMVYFNGYLYMTDRTNHNVLRYGRDLLVFVNNKTGRAQRIDEINVYGSTHTPPFH